MKNNVLVLFGGASSEHEVSCMSALSVIQNISDSYNKILVGITKQGQWLLYSGDEALIKTGDWQAQDAALRPCVVSTSAGKSGLLLLDDHSTMPIDIAFPVLHGKNGEDGTVQGLLDLARIPYVGCKLLASAACMDKDVCKKLLAAANIPVADGITLTKADTRSTKDIADEIAATIGYPAFVKPANAGSSVGVTRIDEPAQLQSALDTAFKEDYKLLIEKGIVGAEVECAVMGNDNPIASAVLGEVAPVRGVYDYEGKYLDDSANLFIPARIGEEQAQLIRETALAAYKALGCSGLSRVDFFALADGSIILNEINTMPGFTSISMFPKLFIASGVSYPSLIQKLLDYAAE